MNEQKGLDILGIKPIGEAINTVVTKSFEGIEGFLKLVCAPALEEIGLLFKDEVRHWRLNNILKILHKAKGKLQFTDEKLHIRAHPRVALSIIDNGSLNDDDVLQELWAGLFISSCTQDGRDDENLIFVDLLKQITVTEARIIKYSCENARKILFKNGLMMGDKLQIDCKKLIEITGVKDIHRLDRELDHLRALQLISSSLLFGGGFDEGLTATITPTALALNLYVKSQGHNSDPANFWTSGIVTREQVEDEKQEIEMMMNFGQTEIEKQGQENKEPQPNGSE